MPEGSFSPLCLTLVTNYSPTVLCLQQWFFNLNPTLSSRLYCSCLPAKPSDLAASTYASFLSLCFAFAWIHMQILVKRIEGMLSESSHVIKYQHAGPCWIPVCQSCAALSNMYFARRHALPSGNSCSSTSFCLQAIYFDFFFIYYPSNFSCLYNLIKGRFGGLTSSSTAP